MARLRINDSKVTVPSFGTDEAACGSTLRGGPVCHSEVNEK
jgi:hypothetical protein